MATDVQQLLLKIDATTELARRELRQMDGEFDRFARRSEEAAGGVDKAFGNLGAAAKAARATIVGFAVGIGVDGIGQFGRAILQAADDIDAAAEKAGIGVERFQTLKESLRSLEVDGEKVDGIFARLTDTLGAVQGGTAAEGVANALDRMGIRTRILNGEISSTDELLDAIAASAGTFNTQAEFTASVIDIVGRKLGVDLANALKDGGAALKEGEAAFQSAGAVISEDYIARLADANEAIDRFASRSKSALVIWAAETLGYLDTVGQRFSQLTAQQVLNTPLIALERQLFAPVSADTPQIDVGFGNSAGFGGFGGRSPQPVKTPPRATTTSARAGGSRSGAAAKRQLSPAELRANADFGPTGLGIDSSKAIADLDAIAAKYAEIQTIAVDLSNIEIINPAQQAAFQRFGENLTSNLAQAIVFGQDLGTALVNAFKAAAAEALASGLFNLLTGAIGGGGGGLGGIFSSIFGGARASGGPISAGRAYLVGERGPEIIMPRAPGTVIPNNAIGGSGGQVVNIDARGASDPGEVERRVRIAIADNNAQLARLAANSRRTNIPRGLI